MVERWSQWLQDHPLSASAALVLTSFAVYLPALSNGFAFDDERVIVQNPYVANPDWWRHIFSTSSWAFLGALNQYPYYRPLQIFAYWLIWRLNGANPAIYHLFQVLLYAASGWLLYKIGCRLIHQRAVAFAGTMLWVLHPLHVEAVDWAAALPDVAVGFFLFLALLLFLHAEQRPEPSGRFGWRQWAAALAFGVALLFKENALALPLLLVAYWFFLAAPERWAGRLLRFVPYLAVLVAYVVLRVEVLGHFVSGGHLWRITGRIAGAALALLGAHLQLFVWPARLSPVRAFNWVAELHTVWPYLALALLVAGWLWRKRQPLFAFCVVVWLVTLAPCLDIRQLTFPFAADRYSYLPSFGLCWALAWLILECLARLRRGHVAATAALGAVALLWTVSTEATLPRWRNTLSVMQYGLREYPDSGSPHIFEGMELQYRWHDLKAAAEQYRTAVRVTEASRPVVITVICQAHLELGQIAFNEQRPEDARREFKEVLRLCPDGHQAFSVYDALGSMAFVKGHYAAAAESFRQAVRWGPADISGHFYLGTCEIKLGHYRQAAEQFHIVTQIDPRIEPGYVMEARALEAAGDSAGARRVRQEAARHAGGS